MIVSLIKRSDKKCNLCQGDVFCKICQDVTAISLVTGQQVQVHDTQEKIMAAAVAAFGQYGFKKTTMQDIADQASMSRPAVYQYYNNKAAVFHGLLCQVLGQAKQAADVHFLSQAEIYHRLTEGVLAFEKVAMAPTLSTAKGHELLGLAESMEAEEMEAIRHWLFNRVYDLLIEGVNSKEISFHHLDTSGAEVTQLILAGLTGVKHSVSSQEELEMQTRMFFKLMWQGLKDPQ